MSANASPDGSGVSCAKFLEERGSRPSPLIVPRIVVCVQLASLAAMAALSRADRRMLGDFNDMVMACFVPIMLAYLFSFFVAPWIVIASAWKCEIHELRAAGILLLETGIVLALLYAAVPMVQ